MVTANLQKTSETKSKSVNYEVVGGRKNVIRKEDNIVKTSSRAQIGHQTSILPSLYDLPMIDRSLIDYTKYHKYVGHAGRKYSMAMQATRGCPYKCFYCDIYKTTINVTYKKQKIKKTFGEKRQHKNILMTFKFE